MVHCWRESVAVILCRHWYCVVERGWWFCSCAHSSLTMGDRMTTFTFYLLAIAHTLETYRKSFYTITHSIWTSFFSSLPFVTLLLMFIIICCTYPTDLVMFTQFSPAGCPTKTSQDRQRQHLPSAKHAARSVKTQISSVFLQHFHSNGRFSQLPASLWKKTLFVMSSEFLQLVWGVFQPRHYPQWSITRNYSRQKKVAGPEIRVFTAASGWQNWLCQTHICSL